MIRFLCVLLATLVLQAQEVRLQVLATTDTHAHLMPEDPFTLRPRPKGWAKLATLIRQQKARQANTLLLDCGDTFQGDPGAYVRHRVRPTLPDPAVAVMNALGYHTLTVGNHDLDFGLDTLRNLEEQAQFPFLAANLLDARNGRPAFTPYTLHTFDGVRVAVLGLTTSETVSSAGPETAARLGFRNALETARDLIPRLRKQEKADLVIVALHGGSGPLDGSSTKNCGLALADQVPGIDLLLMGHTHQELTGAHKEVPMLQAGSLGQTLGQAELVLRRERGAWKVVAREVRLLPVTAETPLDPEVLSLTEAQRRETEAYLDTPATTLLTELDGRWSRMEDSALVQLIHTVQRKATGAQLSAAASPGTRFYIPKGPTSVRQFYALMPYENLVGRIRITGAQLKAYLEHAARYYHFSYEPELFNKEIPGYDYDMIDGASYALDLGKPVGQRVQQLKVDGRPVKPEDSFTLALTSYRLGNGGGYLTAIGFQGQPEMIHTQGLRNLILEHVLARPTLSVELQNHWRTIPYLDRERVLAQSK